MTNNDILFELENVETYSPFEFKHPLNLIMRKSEQWIVYGRNGSGKSFLIDTIRSAFRVRQGQIRYNFSSSPTQRVSDNIKYVTFHDQYTESNEPTFYQLRWNQGLIDDTEPTVGEMFNELMAQCTIDKETLNALNIDDLREKRLVMLSSGEFRRFQIARIVLHNPHLLIIDNPFIGLDEQNRAQVSTFLNLLIKKLKIQIILIVSRMVADTSAFTHVIKVTDGEIEKIPITSFNATADETGDKIVNQETLRTIHSEIISLSNSNENLSEQAKSQALLLRNVTIRYNERTILKNLSWEVNYGEKWSLEGENGAGKSTLLSLICADNPQSYACDITLFGMRRGTGESIWDIKKHIGYVSPEMYRTYRKVTEVKNIVASGLYDSVGLFHRFTQSDYDKIDFWLRLFGIQHLKDKNYMNLSGGEQRLVLLTRAFVKDPDLLILDEPFHGLDAPNRIRSKQIIDSFCQRPGKTIIMVSHYHKDFPTCITHHLKLNKNK